MRFYRCDVCGNLVEQIYDSGMAMTCCRQEMRELKAGESDGAMEKHVPVCTIDGNRVYVTVGSVEHPMTKEHYIQWIAIETTHGHQFRHLGPEQIPSAKFLLTEDEHLVAVYAYCNLHGLWKAN